MIACFVLTLACFVLTLACFVSKLAWKREHQTMRAAFKMMQGRFAVRTVRGMNPRYFGVEPGGNGPNLSTILEGGGSLVARRMPKAR